MTEVYRTIGILIHNNTVFRNAGCSFTIGTGLILCDTAPVNEDYSLSDKHDGVFGQYSTYEDVFYDHLYVNQKGNHHPFTQKLATKFLSQLKNDPGTNDLKF